MSELKPVQKEPADVGVLVARFHTDNLTEGHKQLIDHVCKNHLKVFIFLGLGHVPMSMRNPLDFQSRKQMVESYIREQSQQHEEYGDVIINYIEDMRYDQDWSDKLDGMISKLGGRNTIMLYGSRDSFAKRYSGKYDVTELEPTVNISASEIRRRLRISTKPTTDFRGGMIYAVNNRHPIVYGTVDVAIMNDDYTEVLLCKKPKEPNFRFCGGFSEPTSMSDEVDVRREAGEECCVEISDPKYIGSLNIKDWRYEGEVDCIRTRFFIAKKVYGLPNAKDDVEEVKWFKVDEIKEDDIMEEHWPLCNMLFDYLKTNK